MESRMDLFPEFLASLPAAGWDGTLKKRLKRTGDPEALQGLFRAKTGTLTEPVTVASLAGYFRHPKHGLTAFCVLENGREGTAQPNLKDLRDRQDRLMALLMGEG
jgi:D-alanyl-D-alanine carboxypeptidase/D-alanyl-D-alanine-endopeptidase (penicillin-binding protein 4)